MYIWLDLFCVVVGGGRRRRNTWKKGSVCRIRVKTREANERNKRGRHDLLKSLFFFLTGETTPLLFLSFLLLLSCSCPAGAPRIFVHDSPGSAPLTWIPQEAGTSFHFCLGFLSKIKKKKKKKNKTTSYVRVYVYYIHGLPVLFYLILHFDLNKVTPSGKSSKSVPVFFWPVAVTATRGYGAKPQDTVVFCCCCYYYFHSLS